MEKRINILMLGGPGSGKGTSGVYLSEKLNLKHLSAGESYRRHIREETEIGLRVKAAIASGGLADNETTTEMTRGEVREFSGPNVPTQGFIFDGFPRNLEQGPLLDGILKDEDLGDLDLVIFLKAKDSTLKKRLKERAVSSGRPEDTDDDYCKKRIEVFHEQTKPLVKFYKDRGILVEIPECNGVDALHVKLDELIAKHFPEQVEVVEEEITTEETEEKAEE